MKEPDTDESVYGFNNELDNDENYTEDDDQSKDSDNNLKNDKESPPKISRKHKTPTKKTAIKTT